MSEAKKRKLHAPGFQAKAGLETLRGVKSWMVQGDPHRTAVVSAL